MATATAHVLTDTPRSSSKPALRVIRRPRQLTTKYGRVCDGCGGTYHRASRFRVWNTVDGEYLCYEQKFCPKCFKGRAVGTVLRVMDSSLQMR